MENSKLHDLLNFVLRLVDLIRWPTAIVVSLFLILKILKGI